MSAWYSGTLTIAAAATESEELDLTDSGGSRWKKNLGIRAPATLPETVTVHLAEATGGTYAALQSGGGDITLPANRWTNVADLTEGAMKLVAGSPVAVARVFTIRGAMAKK